MDSVADLATDRARPAIAFDSLAEYRRLCAMEQAGADGRALLRAALTGPLAGRIAAVSSFGADSAVLLSVIAEIDPGLPVVFLETGKHFLETLAYRARLATHLGLTDVRDIAPAPASLEARDPTGELWYYDPDACCDLRKVEPLDQALSPFSIWVSGRKRHQSTTRAALRFVELDGDRIKLNPLADWDGPMLRAELVRRRLPLHALVSRGYPSIGCATCTRSVGAGEDERAGRWSGSGKVECGIHKRQTVTA